MWYNPVVIPQDVMWYNPVVLPQDITTGLPQDIFVRDAAETVCGRLLCRILVCGKSAASSRYHLIGIQSAASMPQKATQIL